MADGSMQNAWMQENEAGALFPDEADEADDGAPVASGGDNPITQLSSGTPPPPEAPAAGFAGPVDTEVGPQAVPCFTPGTLIETDEGRVPVEELMPGDRVLTRDRGYRRLLWAGARRLGTDELARRPQFAPIRISRGALGGGLPERDMMVSPQHRMLVTGPRAELLFGVGEVLVAACHMIGLPGVVQVHGGPVIYVHLLFDRHELVRADGCWSESFQPGDLTLAGMDGAQRSEIEELFPEIAGGLGLPGMTSVRPTIRAFEARALLHR